MMYEKVLFVIPPFVKKLWAPFAGVGYLSTFLTHNGINNDVLDMTLGYDVKDLFNEINRFKPDLIAISMMTHRYNITYNLITQLRSKFSIHVVIGGPHVSTLRSRVLEDCDADFAIKLEGELTLKELCEGKNLEEIDGLICRSEGRVIENKDRKFIKDLDNVPFPTYEKFELEKYPLPDGIPIVSSRGCPYSCTFCPVKTTIGQVLRVRSAGNVVDEIEFWYERGYKKFGFQDDNFTFYKERVFEICELIKRRNLRGLILRCPNGVRADKIDRDLLKKMKEVGFKLLAFGVEGGNNKILRNLRKGEKIETIENAIKNACNLGFDVVLFFLVGSPGETPEDVKDSVNLALKYPVSDALFYNLIPYPQTELYNWIEKNNYFVKDPDEYLATALVDDSDPKFATPDFPLEERKRMLAYTKEIRKEIRKKSIQRRLPKFIIPRKIWARILASDFVGKNILQSKIFLKTYDFHLRRQTIK